MKTDKERYADIYKDKDAAAQMVRQTDIDTDCVDRIPLPCTRRRRRPLPPSASRLRPPKGKSRTAFRIEINHFPTFPRRSTNLPGTQLFLSKFRLIIKIPISQYCVHMHGPSPSVAEKCALCSWTLIIRALGWRAVVGARAGTRRAGPAVHNPGIIAVISTAWLGHNRSRQRSMIPNSLQHTVRTDVTMVATNTA